MNESRLRERAERVLLRPLPPLLRGAERLWADCPAWFTDAAGARLHASNGRDYLDLEMGRGPNILGYAHPVTERARLGFRAATARAGLYHPAEIELAELLAELVPCAELACFAKNGSDVTGNAVRIARTVTGRDLIVSSGYHGFGDWYVADTQDAEGFPDGFRGYLSSVPLNDAAGLQRSVEQAGARLAGIIVEPAHRVLPDPGFLELCRTLADKASAVLIFDEVVTAFRLDIGGGQRRFGVLPDLACLGKAMSNGLALSALVGSRELMRALERSFYSMTYAHDNEAFTVAGACIRHLRDTPALETIAGRGESLRAAFDSAAQGHGLPARALGFSARLDLDFPPAPPLDTLAQRHIFGTALLERDILPTVAIFACELLSDEDVRVAGEAFEEGMARIAIARERSPAPA